MCNVLYVILNNRSLCLISDPPFFTVRPAQYYQRQPTQSVTMPCVAEGDPKPGIAWRKVRNTGSESSNK